MKRLLSIPLRVLLPVLLLSCAAIAGLISWQLNTRLLVGEIESQFLDEARLRITGLQATLEYLFRNHDANGVNVEVSGLATRHAVIAAFVLDGQNRVLAATRVTTIGQSAEAIEVDLPADLKGRNAAQISQVRVSTHGSMVLSGDRSVAVAYYPLLVDVDDHALRSVRNGVLVLVFDVQIAKARALRAAGRQALNHALVFGGLAACAWVFLHFSLTRRAAKLVATTKRLASGDLSARAEMEGNDELGQVGKAFDVMAARIGEDTRKLATSLSLLNATLDSTADGILAIQFNGKVVCSNTKFAVMWGMPAEVLAKGNETEMIAFIASQVRDSERFADRIKELRTHPDAEAFDIIELKDARFFERYVKPQRIDGRNMGIVINFREITERKRAEAELENIHKQLLETSRQAGMAEIATNVLHNVGNVLNSVNVSASLAVESVRKSKASGLAKAVELIREHESDLGTFVTTDPRGKLLPTYLAQFAGNLIANQDATVRELDLLRVNIEHIKEIVSMQQSYANISGVKEIVNIHSLVEDSLRMNVNALDRHGVELIREYGEVPLLNIDKHKVLQILVNLERNAKYACDESGRPDKRLTVRLANGGEWVKISVSDNGVGIPQENLTRIFNHGFTTRKNGHGFGLHSGALAAKEMGGSLTVLSDGPGHGATFTLKLPSPPVVLQP